LSRIWVESNLKTKTNCGSDVEGVVVVWVVFAVFFLHAKNKIPVVRIKKPAKNIHLL
jgi:hypothetical protein